MDFLNAAEQEHWGMRGDRRGDEHARDSARPHCNQKGSAGLSYFPSLITILLLCLPAYGQARYSGSLVFKGNGVLGVSQAGTQVGENAYCPKGGGTELTEQGTPLWGASDGLASLPSQCMYTGTDATPSPGNVFTPADSASLTNVLASANGGPAVSLAGATGGSYNLSMGDVIQLTAGATYTNSADNTAFTFPNIAASAGKWITVRTSQWQNANFPAEGTQATPCMAGYTNTNGNNFPGYPDFACPNAGTVLSAKIMPAASGGGDHYSFSFAAGANHYRFVGIEAGKQFGYKPGTLVPLQSDKFTQGADHIVFDRMWFHGDPWTLSSDMNTELGAVIVVKNSRWVALINSWAIDSYCNSSCVESHVFSGGTGSMQDGPFKLYNNVLATAGATWMFGGSGTGPGTPNTSDVEIRYNLSMKPLAWMIPIDRCWQYPANPTTKNLGEVKNVKRMLLEGNRFWNSWQGCQSDQDGTAIKLNPANQDNFQDITIHFDGTNLVTRDAGGSFLQNCGGQANCSPADASACTYQSPDGTRGCVMEVTSGNNNNTKFRFCNGTNGCNQTGDLVNTASILGNVPAESGVHVNACVPGDCPSCLVQHAVVRYNEFYNLTNGAGGSTSIGHCSNEAAASNHFNLHDNLMRGLSVEMTNATTFQSSSQAFSFANGYIGPAIINTIEIAHNTVAIEDTGGTMGGLGVQRDHTDRRVLSGFNYHDNVSVEAYHIARTGGVHVSGGLAPSFPPGGGYQTDSCTPYYPNEAPYGIVAADGTTFTFGQDVGAKLGTNYLVTSDGVVQTITQHPEWNPPGFVTSATQHAGDAVTIRDINDCSWTFTGNIIGTGLAGGSYDETPYPAGNILLSGSAFTGIFANYQPRSGGDYSLAGSIYHNTATDAANRSATGKDPGVDLTTLATLLLPTPAINYLPLSISTSTLPAATAGTAYQAALATPAYGTSGGGASPFKRWCLASSSNVCVTSDPALPNSAGIVIGPDGAVNTFRVSSASRASGVSTFDPNENPIAGVWTVGQVITLSGFDTSKGANDPSFNGTCTITAIANATVSCAQAGVDIASHSVNKQATIGFAPITAGSYTFRVGANDGAFQKAWAQISLTVN